MIHLDVQTQPVIDSSRLGVPDQLRLLWRLQRFMLPYWDKVLLRCLCSLAMAITGVLPPLLARKVVDEAIAGRDVKQLWTLVAFGLGCVLYSRAVAFIGGADRWDEQPLPGNVMAAFTMAKIAVDLKHRFYRHVQKLSLRFYGSRPVGEHMFRCTIDVDDAAFLASEVIPKISSAVQRGLVLFLVLEVLIAPWVKYPVTIYLVLFFCTKHWLTTRIRRYDRQWRVEYQRLEAVLREVLFPFSLIWAYTRKRTARRWYVAQACRTVRSNFMRGLFWIYDLFISLFLLGTFITIMNLLVGEEILAGRMSLGDYAAVGGLVIQFIGPFQDGITAFQLIRQKLVPGERMLETLEIEPEVVDAPEAINLPPVKGKIELRDVWFSYIDGIDVLKGVSIVAHAGEKIALVGPTGAGKSTLCNLILRLYDPQRGELFIDDTPYKRVTQESLRRDMSIVMQNINTFTESVKKNILYARPTATDEEVMRAAHVAHIDEFVSKMEDKYDTVLSEGGAISGGQKQRLCLARALVRDAKVLILDEATSSLDPVTEKEVVDNIDEAYGDRTQIVVAHNVLNARTADRIYVLDEGEVVEVGTHGELMAKGGIYKTLWST